MSTTRLYCLEQAVNKLNAELDERLKSNLTEGGKAFIYAIKYWSYYLSFIKEYQFDQCLFNYLQYLLCDVRNLVANYGSLEDILEEIRFYYDEHNYRYMK